MFIHFKLLAFRAHTQAQKEREREKGQRDRNRETNMRQAKK